MRVDDSSLDLGFAEGSVALDRVSEPNTLKSLEELSHRYFKKGIKWKITPTDLVSQTKRESKASTQREESDLARHLKKEALGSPIVKEAVEIFKGRIVGVKIKEGS